MISVIVCSINEALFNNFEINLAETIGVQYEVIRIDNTGNKHSICQAYNIGAGKSQYEYLCFVHEDILFRTKDWGQLLISYFDQRQDAGLIGVAGAKYKSLSPSGWMTGDAGLDCYNLYQYYPLQNQLFFQANNPEPANNLIEVKVLDGVFLMTKKSIWLHYKFDEKTFQGFHCYDLDYCMQVGEKHKLFVSSKLVLEHFSAGSSRKEWIENAILFTDKWKQKLPTGNIAYKKKKQVEWGLKRLFFLRMRNYGLPFFKIIAIFFSYGYLKYFNLKGNLQFITEIYKSLAKRRNG